MAYSIRPATEDDVVALTEVVLAVVRAEERLPADFDEPAWSSE